MRTNEVEETLGLGREAIRYYINKGLLKSARDKNGYREYVEEDLAQLKRVLVLRDLGFSIQEISEILKGDEVISKAILEERQQAIQQEKERVARALEICSDLIASDADINFDPEPYFRKRF